MFGLAGDRPALLQERMAHTARAMQATALNAAALLERQAERTRPPTWLDYPTEIKRWRGFADRAEQMAKRWEQRPYPMRIGQIVVRDVSETRLRTALPDCEIAAIGTDLHITVPLWDLADTYRFLDRVRQTGAILVRLSSTELS